MNYLIMEHMSANTPKNKRLSSRPGPGSNQLETEKGSASRIKSSGGHFLSSRSTTLTCMRILKATCRHLLTPSIHALKLQTVCVVLSVSPIALKADWEPQLEVTNFAVNERTEVWIERLGYKSTFMLYVDGLPKIRLEDDIFFPLTEEGACTEPWPDPPPLQDLNNDGALDWAFASWSGGSHCCRTLYIITLEPEPFLLTKLQLDDSKAEPLVDLDADGHADLEARDWAFAYWKVPFAASPAPKVTLSLRGDQFELNLDAMRISPAKAEVILGLADKTRQLEPSRGEPDIPDSWYWAHILDLVYGGYPKLAAQFALRAWPFSTEARQAFFAQFKETYAKSKWYPALQANWSEFEAALKAQPLP